MVAITKVACQPDFKYVSCSKYYESVRNVHTGENGGWTKIEGNVSKKKCSHVLELENTTGNQSGIYRCIEHGKVLKSYEVEITDFTKYSGMPPELLDVIPSNVTVQQNAQIIIQCKVYSQQPPVILWFKQSDSTNYDIQYFDKFYIRINTSVQVHPVPHEVNVYMSKLNIHDIREIDSGLYVCVAMTEHGKDLKHATVKVISSTTNWEPHTSFSLLFLIPLVFALIPVTVWLCYYRKKMKHDSRNPLQIQQERKLIRPVLATNGQNHVGRSSVI
ncbi:fibroblast growth factor receptor-like 1 [Agrilus planipennis]|uniref:Fibroblast growth factor receptor-like 1 n=1 Tax=Agrilus planipennis TaxID=224129 RepID=A0A1W4WZU1_AGRPL|nr:fibroblast growth factor receptor-like 1 [Agrilus planipennis]